MTLVPDGALLISLVVSHSYYFLGVPRGIFLFYIWDSEIRLMSNVLWHVFILQRCSSAGFGERIDAFNLLMVSWY